MLVDTSILSELPITWTIVVAIGASFLSFLLVMPPLMRMALKKDFTDHPNERKLQKSPITVTGGLGLIMSICFSVVIGSMFVNLNTLFVAICISILLAIVGMIDDAIDLSSTYKFIIQFVLIGLLFFVGNYRIDHLNGFLGIHNLSMPASCLISIFSGLLIVNAINFIDGIDGLAAVLGIFICTLFGIWCVRHGEYPHAVLSFIFLGALIGYLPFNIVSERYKVYMGDSGSLLLGLYVYLSACVVLSCEPGEKPADTYNVSFVLATLAVPIFDLARVVVVRLLKRRSPFYPDRSHLHHLYVDLGLPHFYTSLLILVSNALVLVVWSCTARNMSVTTQTFIVVASAIAVVVVPQWGINSVHDGRLASLKKHRGHASEWSNKRNRLASSIALSLDNVLARVVHEHESK